jgi:hypothetical protein
MLCGSEPSPAMTDRAAATSCRSSLHGSHGSASISRACRAAMRSAVATRGGTPQRALSSTTQHNPMRRAHDPQPNTPVVEQRAVVHVLVGVVQARGQRSA